MRIAVIGTGNVGRTLGGRWRSAGHEVVYGSRGASDQGPDGAAVMEVGDALAEAEVVVLAVPGSAVAEVAGAHGPALQYKVVIDAANRVGEDELNSRAAIVAAAPRAVYARAFNSLGWENYAEPPPGAALFYAADPAARPAVEELITAVGLEPVFLGDADARGTVDALLPLWFALVTQRGGNRKLALRLVTG